MVLLVLLLLNQNKIKKYNYNFIKIFHTILLKTNNRKFEFN